MTTLHMDVEQARQTQSTMSSTHQQLASLMQSLTSAVLGLEPAWLGNSASEFFGDYEQLKTSTNKSLDDLNLLSGRLQKEIDEWEMMASKLSA